MNLYDLHCSICVESQVEIIKSSLIYFFDTFFTIEMDQALDQSSSRTLSRSMVSLHDHKTMVDSIYKKFEDERNVLQTSFRRREESATKRRQVRKLLPPFYSVFLLFIYMNACTNTDKHTQHTNMPQNTQT